MVTAESDIERAKLRAELEALEERREKIQALIQDDKKVIPVSVWKKLTPQESTAFFAAGGKLID